MSHSVHVSEFKKKEKKNGSNKKSILASDITLIDTEIILSLKTNSIHTRFYTTAKTKLFRFELGQNHKNTCIPLLDKRGQRALGRSPEEKVKGHNILGSNNREPQGHNLNNFGRGPFDDVIY